MHNTRIDLPAKARARVIALLNARLAVKTGGTIIWAAAEKAAGMDELLALHGEAIRRHAPTSWKLYSRMRATYSLTAGYGQTGLRQALDHLKNNPLSLRSWIVLSLAMIAPRVLLYAAHFRHRATSIAGG